MALFGTAHAVATSQAVPLWVKVVVPLGAALLGGIIAGVGTWLATSTTLKHDRLQRAQDSRQRTRAFLLAVKDEIEALWERYMIGIGDTLEQHQHGEPFLWHYPVIQDYFIIFKQNAGTLGLVDDDALRKLVVTTFTKGQGIIDSYRYNNYLNTEYERLKDTPKEQDYRQRLIAYAVGLHQQHDELKREVQQLSLAIDHYLSEREPRPS